MARVAIGVDIGNAENDEQERLFREIFEASGILGDYVADEAFVPEPSSAS